MKWWLFSVFLCLSSQCFGALNKTYPTSATTLLRMETYMDAITTIYNSTVSVNYSTTTFPQNCTGNNGYGFTINESTWTMYISSDDLKDYVSNFVMDMKLKFINQIADDDMEQYMVFPSSYVPTSAKPWSGWCQQIINGRSVAIVCP